MKTFRAHTSFRPGKGNNLEYYEQIILPNTDYEVLDTNQAFGIYVKMYDKIGKVYISPEEIKQYGIVDNKLTIEELQKILNNITFAPSCVDFNWGWEISEVEGGENTSHGFLINTTFKRPDTNTGQIGIGKGRRMWVEETASETSVVMTAWVCIKLIVEHELLESYIYKGAKILNPHKSLGELAYPEKLK